MPTYDPNPFCRCQIARQFPVLPLHFQMHHLLPDRLPFPGSTLEDSFSFDHSPDTTKLQILLPPNLNHQNTNRNGAFTQTSFLFTHRNTGGFLQSMALASQTTATASTAFGGEETRGTRAFFF